MTIERAKRLAEQWSSSGVCTLRDGEAQEYHSMFLSMLLGKQDDVSPVRHGRWIYHPDDLFPGDSTQECSCCHEEEYLTLYNENYCPNCGAKMDGEM